MSLFKDKIEDKKVEVEELKEVESEDNNDVFEEMKVDLKIWFNKLRNGFMGLTRMEKFYTIVAIVIINIL